MDNLKQCTKCKKHKKLNKFSEEKRTAIGLQSRCKQCLNKYGRKYWHKNHTKSLLRKKEYREKNREQLNRKARKRYYDNLIENRKAKRELWRLYYKNNPEKFKKRARDWAKDNREKVRIMEENYKKNSPEKYKERNRRKNLKARQLRKTDPKKRINFYISETIRRQLKARHSNKNGKCKNEYLSYTIDELTQHLERLFKDNMSWDNYGKNGWEIDHIIPIVSFDFVSVDDKQFKECWALKNLRPLWYWENRKKGIQILETSSETEKIKSGNMINDI